MCKRYRISHFEKNIDDTMDGTYRDKEDKSSAFVSNMNNGDYLVSRDSINSLKHQGSTYANIILKEVFKYGYEDRSFNLSYLKKEFRNRELEVLFRRYEQRSMIGTFTVYLTLQTFLSLAYISTTAIKVSLCYLMLCYLLLSLCKWVENDFFTFLHINYE